MMTRQEIQADLREIRYYYSMKEMFDKSADTVKPLAIIEKVNRYNKAMENAPAANAASSTAFFSTSVTPLGTQTEILGFLPKRLLPTAL